MVARRGDHLVRLQLLQRQVRRHQLGGAGDRQLLVRAPCSPGRSRRAGRSGSRPWRRASGPRASARGRRRAWGRDAAGDAPADRARRTRAADRRAAACVPRSPGTVSATLSAGPRCRAWGSRSGLSCSSVVDVDAGVLSEISPSVSPEWTIQTPLRHGLPARLADRVVLLSRRRRLRCRRPAARGRDHDDHQDEGRDQGHHGEHADDLVRLVVRHPRAAIVPGGLPPHAGASRRPDGPGAPRRRPPGRRRRRCCAAAATSTEAGRPGASAGPRSSGLPPCAPIPGIRKIESGISSRSRPEVLRRGRADHGAQRRRGPTRRRAAARSPRPARPAPRAADGPPSCASWSRAAPGLEVRTSRKTPAPAAVGGVDQDLDRVLAEQRVGGEGVGAEARDGPPGRLRLPDQRLAVGLRGHRHVAALAVGDHQQAGLARGRADLGPAPASRERRAARSRRAAASPRRRPGRRARSARGSARRPPPRRARRRR